MGRLWKAGAIVAGLALLGWTAWHPLLVSYQHWILRDMFEAEPALLRGVGPAAGSHFPGLRAQGDAGPVTLLDPLAGARGTVLVNLQSVADSPFCAEQLRQLQHYANQFSANGLSLVVLSQDAPEELQAFAARNGIAIPLLSDIQALSVKTLGLLAQREGPGDARQITPGVVLVDPNGVVVRTLAMANPQRRMDSKHLLSLAIGAIDDTPEG